MFRQIRSVGITATRNGMTDPQKDHLREYLEANTHLVIHHGDCLGGDADAHAIAERLGLKIVIHPPSNDSLRAFCTSQFIEKPLAYMVRNKNVVERTDTLFGFPETQEEILRSGTWSTIRLAVRKNKPVVVVFPDGRIGNNGGV